MDKLIVEEEQGDKEKVQYGKAVLKNLSNQLMFKFGKGYDERNLNNMQAFYTAFSIWDAVRTELSWTYYRIISRIQNPSYRLQYVEYYIKNNRDTRTLQRNIKNLYLNRQLEMPKSEGTPVLANFITDPYIFEFLNFPADNRQTENTIETALINHLQQFIMELGKGYAFVARQQHIIYN